MRRFIMPVIALALVAGCSSNGSVPAPAASEGSPSPSGPPADGGTYTSADAILAQLTALGLACGAPNAVANATAPGATSMVDCDSQAGAGAQDTVVVVFDTAAHALAYAGRMASMGFGQTQVVYGRNWAVNTVPPYGEQIKGALGGEMVSGAEPSTS